MITYFLNPADLERLTALDLAERARLCNPASIDAAFATIATIAARAELARVRREMARRAIRAAIRPLVIEVTPDMISTSPSQPGIDIKHSSGVDIRVKGVAAQMPLLLEAA